MKEETKGNRSPTSDKLSVRSKTSEAMKKKLYRKRTMDEVRKSLEYGGDICERLDGNGADADESTVNLATDTAYSAGEYIAEYARGYSNKLKSERGETISKRSGALRTERISESGTVRDGMSVSSSVSKVSNGASGSDTVRMESKRMQKKRLKKEYARAVREAEKAAKSAGKEAGRVGIKATEDTAGIITKMIVKVGNFIKDHPLISLIVAIILIVVLAVIVLYTSVSTTFGGISDSIISTMYSAEDEDIYGAEADYAAKEAELLTRVNNITTTYPGYDEYNYDLDTIEHDPYALASYLTVKHEDYSRSDVQGTLSTLYDSQYVLTVTPRTETRYREEERTGSYGVPVYDEEGNLTGYDVYYYSYTVQVPYDYYILDVSLENKGLENVIDSSGLDEDMKEIYEYLLENKGEKPYLW